MNKNAKWHLQEAYRFLELALIGVREKNRKLIQEAIEHFNQYVEKKK